MAQQIWTTVDGYLNQHLAGDDAALLAAIEASDVAGLPAIQVSATEGKLLMLLARSIGARAILEIGTLGGYSAIWLARALAPGGRLVTCELNAKHAEVARGNLQRAGLSDRVQIKVGPATETLSQLAAEHSAAFDMVFIDADKAGYPDYLMGALRLSRPGTLIVADNVVLHGRVIDETSIDPDVLGMRRFVELLGSDPRLSATAVQTVGRKGHDGFALAVVTGKT